MEEIEAASSSGDPHSQSLMGFVYGTGMMREKSKSKFFLHHNFAAEGGNMQSKMTLAFTYHVMQVVSFLMQLLDSKSNFIR